MNFKEQDERLAKDVREHSLKIKEHGDLRALTLRHKSDEDLHHIHQTDEGY